MGDFTTTQPKLPVLDGTNYGYWKSKMETYIRNVDNHAWVYVITEWTPPLVEYRDADGVTTDTKPKPIQNWTDAEHRAATLNAKALFAINSGVNTDEYKKICKCTTAFEAWRILHIAHEGEKAMRENKLLILNNKFESMRMGETEPIKEYVDKLREMSNISHSLGSEIPDERIVKKVLRSLPKKLKMVGSILKQTRDISEMTIDQLVGAIQHEEIDLAEENEEEIFKTSKKNLSLLASTQTDTAGSQDAGSQITSSQEFQESVILLAKNLPKLMKFQKRAARESSQKPRRNSFRPNTQDDSKMKGIQCHECKGFNHVAAECAVTMKKWRNSQKAMKASWSEDDDSSYQSDDSDAAYDAHVAFTTPVQLTDPVAVTNIQESDDDKNVIDYHEKYKDLCQKWATSCESNRLLGCEVNALKEQNASLELKLAEMRTIASNLQGKVDHAHGMFLAYKKRCEEAEGTLRKFNNSGDKLKELIASGKKPADKGGIGYIDGSEGPKETVFILQGESSSSAKKEADPANKKDTDVPVKKHAGQHLNRPKSNFRQRSEPRRKIDLGDDSSRERPPVPIRNPSDRWRWLSYRRDQEARRAAPRRRERSPRRRERSPLRREISLRVCRSYDAVSGPDYPAQESRVICHYCQKSGHIRPKCFKFLKDMRAKRSSRDQYVHHRDDSRDKVISRRRERRNRGRSRESMKCYMLALRSKLAYQDESWILDSGCSRHMTGNLDHITNFRGYEAGTVAYGDGKVARILGRGTLKVDGMPILKNVYYVHGLKANLISISQLCDAGLEVKFTKTGCTVLDKDENEVLMGARTFDNCYKVVTSMPCNLARSPELELWHKRLGHTHIQGIQRLVRTSTVRGLPKF